MSPPSENAPTDSSAPAVTKAKTLWRAARRRWWSSLLLDLAILLPILWGVMLWQERNLLPADGEHAAPSFELVALEGETYALGRPSDRRTLVYFFAPWCTVCHLSVENVQDVRNAHDEDELDVYLVALDWPDRESVERFVGRHELTVPVLLGTPAVREAYQVDAYPTYYVLDETGNVVARSRGYSTEIGMRLRVAD